MLLKGQRLARPTIGRRRRALFRVASLFIGLAPFLVVEGMLRITRWQPPAEVEDPYVGFDTVRPLFVLNEQSERYEISPLRLDFFCREGFAAVKAPNEFRIFVLGGSTVQGSPFSIETAFSTWLELSLGLADSRRKWEVVNCGGISYASYRLVPILQEVLQYHPDLIIVCSGQNEFLENRTYQHVTNAPNWFVQLQGLCLQSRTYRWCRNAWWRFCGQDSEKARDGKSILPSDADAMLDYEDGLRDYHRDDAWRRGVIEHYEFNIDRMVRLARQAQVPIWLAIPVNNLRDCPPFKSQCKRELTAAQRKQFEQLWQEGTDLIATDPRAALLRLEQAAAIDDRHANVQYDLGQCYDVLQQPRDAKAAYLRAKEEDICPLRILEPMRAAVVSVGRRTNTPVIDLQQLFAEQSPDQIVGDEWLVDHIHPSVEGHQMIAETLLALLVRRGVVQPQKSWETRRKQLYWQHLDSLNFAYFIRGRQRLEGLRLWTLGRANKKRPFNEAK